MELKSFKGAGDVYADIWSADGVSQGMEKWGDADQFEIVVAGEIESQKAHGRNNYGQTLASIVDPGDAVLNMRQTQFDREMMAAQFLGSNAIFSQSATPVVEDEAFVAIHDKWVPLTTRHISSVTICDDAVPTNTYVLGTDYELNTNLGLVKVLSTGDIADGATVYANYTPVAKSGYEVDGLTKTLMQGNILFDGINRVDGKECQVEIYQAIFSPQNGIDFLSSDWAGAELQASLITPSGYTTPFKVRMIE